MPPPVLVVTDRLDQIMAPPREIDSDLQTVLQHLYERRYTGPITLHFKDGMAKRAELPAPKIRLGLTNGQD